MNHTPGPWQVGLTSTGGYSVVSVEETTGAANLDICHVAKYGHEKTEQRANADLIAAAPELLEALRQIRAYLADGGTIFPHTRLTDREVKSPTALEVVNAAIGKAEQP